uniref:Uncharacterized protein n=1 Tax=Parascaris univalens TaxID=6257 RepID=A0A914ZMK2_PARUN
MAKYQGKSSEKEKRPPSGKDTDTLRESVRRMNFIENMPTKTVSVSKWSRICLQTMSCCHRHKNVSHSLFTHCTTGIETRSFKNHSEVEHAVISFRTSDQSSTFITTGMEEIDAG